MLEGCKQLQLSNCDIGPECDEIKYLSNEQNEMKLSPKF